MKYLKIFEEFDSQDEEVQAMELHPDVKVISAGYQSHWDKFQQWLSKRNFDIYDGLESKFMEVASDPLLPSVEHKSNEIAAYLGEKWNHLYMDVVDYLEKLFMDEEDSEDDDEN